MEKRVIERTQPRSLRDMIEDICIKLGVPTTAATVSEPCDACGHPIEGDSRPYVLGELARKGIRNCLCEGCTNDIVLGRLDRARLARFCESLFEHPRASETKLDQDHASSMARKEG